MHVQRFFLSALLNAPYMDTNMSLLSCLCDVRKSEKSRHVGPVCSGVRPIRCSH